MSDGLSLSIFTIEVDRKPVLAVQGRKHSEAEAVLADQYIRNQLSLLRCGGSRSAMISRFFAFELLDRTKENCTTKTQNLF
jgi:hypothetical protein